MDYAFKYIKYNKGIDTEDSYPYEGIVRHSHCAVLSLKDHLQDDKCRFKPSDVGATDTGYVNIVPKGDEKKLQVAVATVGPISVAIDAGLDSFQFYKHGIYDEPDCSPSELDHGVLVVGYGTTSNGVDYWIVKNSWADDWGEDGYIRMVRNKHNQCGIASMASYPLV